MLLRFRKMKAKATIPTTMYRISKYTEFQSSPLNICYKWKLKSATQMHEVVIGNIVKRVFRKACTPRLNSLQFLFIVFSWNAPIQSKLKNLHNLWLFWYARVSLLRMKYTASKCYEPHTGKIQQYSSSLEIPIGDEKDHGFYNIQTVIKHKKWWMTTHFILNIYFN